MSVARLREKMIFRFFFSTANYNEFFYSLSLIQFSLRRTKNVLELKRWIPQLTLLISGIRTTSNTHTHTHKLMPYDARMIDETIRWKINTKHCGNAMAYSYSFDYFQFTMGLRCLKTWNDPPTIPKKQLSFQLHYGKRLRSIKPIEDSSSFAEWLINR